MLVLPTLEVQVLVTSTRCHYRGDGASPFLLSISGWVQWFLEVTELHVPEFPKNQHFSVTEFQPPNTPLNSKEPCISIYFCRGNPIGWNPLNKEIIESVRWQQTHRLDCHDLDDAIKAHWHMGLRSVRTRSRSFHCLGVLEVKSFAASPLSCHTLKIHALSFHRCISAYHICNKFK